MERRSFIKAFGMLPLGLLGKDFLFAESYSSLPILAPEKHSLSLTELKVKNFEDFDSLIKRGQLTVIAGRPSLGKTAFALKIAAFAGFKRNLGVAYFSLEQSKEHLMERLMSQECRISFSEFQKGQLTQIQLSELASVANNISNSKLYIDDSLNKTPAQIVSQIKKLNSAVDVVIVDYLQLMNHDGVTRNRRDQVNLIVHDLKALARDQNISVIITSQLNRQKDPRKIPNISNLRELTEYSSIDKTILLYQSSDDCIVMKTV